MFFKSKIGKLGWLVLTAVFWPVGGLLAAPGTGRFQPVSAAPTFPFYPDGGPFSLQDIINLATEIRNFVMVVAIVVIVLFLIWGALRLIFASGNAEAAASARGMIFTVILGAVIILGTFPLIRTLQGVLQERTLFFGAGGTAFLTPAAGISPSLTPLSRSPLIQPFDP